MFRSIVAVVVAALVTLAPLSAKPLPSVQPIQYQGQTFCTVWSANEQEGYFATAGHCAMYVAKKGLDGKVTILGQPATIEMVGYQYDVAVFRADAHVPALKLAKRAVEVCDPRFIDSCEKISIQGFPYGLPKLITVSGHVAARDVPILHPSYDTVMYSDILDITTTHGNSGSPVFNSRGEVIGILWGGFTDSPHSLSIPLAALQQVLSGYFR